MANDLITFSSDQMDLIKRTYCPGLTDDEVAIFLDNCRSCGLDPKQRQIYAIKRAGKLCIQISIDGLRLIAERTGKYSPGSDTQFLYNDKGLFIGAKVFVKKFTQGQWHEVSATAYLSEYTTNNGLWSKMPHVMCEKAAESRALRRCFPEVLSGLYSEDEMQQADVDKPAPVVPTAKATICISDQSWSELDSFLVGHDDLRAELQKLCAVTNLRTITDSQMHAVRSYTKLWLKKKEVSSVDTKN